MKSLLISVAVVATLGCHSSAAPVPSTGSTSAPAGAPTAVPATGRDVMVRTSMVSESFRPGTGEAALRAFVPEIQPDETGGECQLLRTGGSGATVVTAAYPNRATSKMQVTVTFDSSGRLVRYSERRNIPHFPSMKGFTPAQQDSTLRAGEAATRSTVVTMDYAVDQATAMNRGGGKPTVAILGTVRAIEGLPSLGPPAARLERMRKLCGV